MTSLAAALVAAQKDMPKVEPDGRANYGTYVTLDYLIAKTRPVLNKHGLAITQFPAMSETGAPVLRTVLIHESGEQLSADTPLFLQKNDMQAFGAAITYARRYGWASVLGIAEQEDDDGNRASAPGTGATQSPHEGGGSTDGVGDRQPAVAASSGSAESAHSESAAGGGASADPVTAALVSELLRLSKEFGANVVTVQKSINDNRATHEGYLVKHHKWLERQIATVKANIAEKEAAAKSSFQPPAGATEKAA